MHEYGITSMLVERIISIAKKEGAKQVLRVNIEILLITLTGILVHTFRYWDMPMATYITYAIHLSVDAVFLGTQVGIGKWTHILYRPIGGYFDGLKNRMVHKENIT